MTTDNPRPGEEQDAGRFEGEEQHGWSPDVEEGSVEEGSEDAAAGGAKAFHAEEAGPPGPGREVSEAEQVGPTEPTGETPLGVGESITRRGEDIAEHEHEPGRVTEGTKGPTERPYGTSTAEDSTGVDPQEPIDEESPTLPSGDQGG
ncbi:hypothetical protein C3Y87_18425 [Carbonactinospora thermoautotrophica]|uniref:hypothetical protein n=1 Tax=Carbonactinospora thermoautotrophica TaxID=1469144 RepID=UPI002270D73B|nr:hypothetical protein [Carbonactinospora thermoautotrophica]MCX9193342.1 hypothetical protein [Carbonactinospora thermoautotrophica]